MIRALRKAFLAGLLIFAGPAWAFEGLQISDEHGAIKSVIQKDHFGLAIVEEALVKLRRLISENEAAHGKDSAEIGVLLVDIGEAAIRRGLMLDGEARTDGLISGINAINAGDPILLGLEPQHIPATIGRARGQMMKGRALLALGRLDEAMESLRKSLALETTRFDNLEWQLKVYPYLFDAARQKATQLADADRTDEAYDVVTAALPLEDTARRLFIAAMKPSPFFIYDDPDAPRSKGWDDLQKDPRVSPYDLVSTRVMVDQQLTPFIEDGRNNLMGLLSVMLARYDDGDAEGASYFCRLIPHFYVGYRDEPLPEYCDVSNWVSWYLSMGIVGEATQLAEASLRMLPEVSDASDAENDYRSILLGDLLAIEAYYGSPDSFFATYEEIERAGVVLDDDMEFYAAVISDNAEQARETFGGVLSKLQAEVDPAVGSETRGIHEKLSLAGGAIARDICMGTHEAGPVLRGVMCVTSGELSRVPYEEIETEIREGRVELTTPGVTDWPFLNIARDPRIKAAIADRAPSFVQGIFGSFEHRELSDVEEAFLRAPIAPEDFPDEKGVGLRPFLNDDFDPAHIAIALARAGKLDMARIWGRLGAIRYESTDIPMTIWSAFLAEEHEEMSYREGWAWMLLDHPIIAEASFSTAIPRELTYERGGVLDESALSWERVIGAYHGRILARKSLGDFEGAADDSEALVDYVSFVLRLQSFTRHETRQVVTRIARPALREALATLGDIAAAKPSTMAAAFRAVQLLNQTGTATTVNRLGARLATVSPELAALARQREDLRASWVNAGTDQKEMKTALAGKIDQLDDRLAAEFPQYVELAGTTDLPLADVQLRLSAGEALVSYTVLADRIIAVAVTKDAGMVVPIEIERQDLTYKVDDLRRSLNMAGGRLPSFRSDVAFDLYETLVQPVEDALGHRPKQLILALSDVLESVPFSVLIAERPGRDLAGNAWLVDRYAISRVPSISSLVMMRQIAETPAPGEPFLGIGDPLLEGDGSDFRGMSVQAAFGTSGGVDADALRALPRLAETADELRQLQQMLGASDTNLLLGQAASERRIKRMSLSDYRIIAFATHGLIAGEVGNINEPGLVLTPPDELTDDDNGYLAASEIAELQLGAELVMLSACNTAAPGAVGAEGLSGLAKAFFFAGAQNLLVSHWSVESQSAMELTTRLIEARVAQPELSFALALQKAMISLRGVPGGAFEHPALWGAFEIVGS